MKPLLLLIAAVTSLTGLGLLCCPQRTRGLFLGAPSDKAIRLLAFLPLGGAGALGLGALIDPHLLFLYLLLASLAFLKGIYLLCAPPEQVRSILKWWQEGASSTTLAVWGIVYLILAGYIGCTTLFH